MRREGPPPDRSPRIGVTMSVMEETPARSRRSFTDEFKRDAVAMVLDDGNKIVEVADRLGVGEGTLGNWVARPGSTGRACRGDHVGEDRAGRGGPGERPAANGTRSAQASDSLLGEGVGTVTRYRWVAARKAEGFPITMACRTAEVSRQAFGDWRAGVAGGPSDAEVARWIWSRRSRRSTTSSTAPTARRGSPRSWSVGAGR
jgi:hypothetical protein